MIDKWTAIVLVFGAIALGAWAVSSSWSNAQIATACVSAGKEYIRGECRVTAPNE